MMKPDSRSKYFLEEQFPALLVLYPDEMQMLFNAAEEMAFKANEVVIEEGQKGEYLYLVKSGQFLVSKRYDNHVYEVGTVTQGDMFGEASVLYQSRAGAEVRAVDDCELYAIPAEVVRMVFDSNERFLRATEQLAERRLSASALAVNPVFSALPMAVREVALYNAKYVNFKKGEVIIHEGDEASYMFLILAGRVEVSFRNPGDPQKHIVVAKRGMGDELGDIAVVTGHAHGATVTALNQVRALGLRSEYVAAWSARYSDFAYALYAQVYRKLKENRVVLSKVIDDREARKLTINIIPSLEDFKQKYRL